MDAKQRGADLFRRPIVVAVVAAMATAGCSAAQPLGDFPHADSRVSGSLDAGASARISRSYDVVLPGEKPILVVLGKFDFTGPSEIILRQANGTLGCVSSSSKASGWSSDNYSCAINKGASGLPERWMLNLSTTGSGVFSFGFYERGSAAS